MHKSTKRREVNNILQIPEERLKHAESLPEVTLSAFTETGHTGSSILVPKQRSYIGRYPVIPSSLANTRCADLGAEGVLEKLNIGAEYAWLDVLCLRQVGGRREDLRLEEWKVDVPTIGCVYQRTRVVCYFSGLGRPLSLKAGDIESDQSWFRRAWTLQEIDENPIIGGDTGHNKIMEKEIQREFEKKLSSLSYFDRSGGYPGIFEVLQNMQDRVSKNPVDKVAGLAYLLQTQEIPAYYETQSEEDAWTALVRVMPEFIRTQLLFCRYAPGNGYKVWRPSWRQVMLMPEIEMLPPSRRVDLTEETDADWYRGLCIHSGYVQGLSAPNRRQEGELIVEENSGAAHKFKIVTYHPIPDGFYTLLGCDLDCIDEFIFSGTEWAVGSRSQGQEFRKVSVVVLESSEEVRRLMELPGVAKESSILLA